jgi:hypothetical protein
MLEPSTYTEVVATSTHEKWISAMQAEMQSLEKNDRRDVGNLPKQNKYVRYKWIFKIVEDFSPSEPIRCKHR